MALLAGLAIFPIVFAHGWTRRRVPGLIFQTLPLAFGNMAGGHLFGTLFFVLLTFAAWTSSIGLIEPAVAWSVETHGRSRAISAITIGRHHLGAGLSHHPVLQRAGGLQGLRPHAVREPGSPLEQHPVAARRPVHHHLRRLGDVQDLDRR
jgi:hypothetical protein